MEDKEILKLYLKRQECAIYETDIKYGTFCRGISYRILYNHGDVEECINDSYLKIWNSIPPVVPRSFRAYVGKIVRNLSLNCKKAKKASKRGGGEIDIIFEEIAELCESTLSLDEEVDALLLKDSLTKWLSMLPENQRLVFVGRYWYLDSIENISKKMGYSSSKTKMVLLRLRNSLYEFLVQEGYYL